MSEIEDIGEIVEEEVSEMTDEEKAEEYVKEQILKHNRDVVIRPKNALTYIDELKQAYLAGLAEGRKDVTYMKAEEYDKHLNACRENIKLKKENAELRKGLTRTRIDKCVKKHLTSDMTKKEIPTVPCYEVNDCWLCNIYKEATDEQH